MTGHPRLRFAQDLVEDVVQTAGRGKFVGTNVTMQNARGASGIFFLEGVPAGPWSVHAFAENSVQTGDAPVVVLPGVPTEAIAAWWTLACPALDRLSGRLPREPLGLPLLRKIASGVGVAEVVLLERKGGAWAPLASGEFSLQAIARADAWLAVPAGSEGFAAGATVDACMLAE